MTTTPPQLSSIDRIELCVLTDTKNFKTDELKFGVGLGYVVAQMCLLENEDLNRVVLWWNHHENASVARCHLPAYGLHFYKGDTLFASASICWQCNNIYFVHKQPQEIYSFDGRSPESLKILDLFQKLLPLSKQDEFIR